MDSHLLELRHGDVIIARFCIVDGVLTVHRPRAFGTDAILLAIVVLLFTLIVIVAVGVIGLLVYIAVAEVNFIALGLAAFFAGALSLGICALLVFQGMVFGIKCRLGQGYYRLSSPLKNSNFDDLAASRRRDAARVVAPPARAGVLRRVTSVKFIEIDAVRLLLLRGGQLMIRRAAGRKPSSQEKSWH